MYGNLLSLTDSGGLGTRLIHYACIFPLCMFMHTNTLHMHTYLTHTYAHSDKCAKGCYAVSVTGELLQDKGVPYRSRDMTDSNQPGDLSNSILLRLSHH